MPSEEWKQFYEECLKYECRHCNAQKGNPCQDTNLRKTKPHSARQEALRRDKAEWRRQKTSECPTCGGKGRLPIVGADPRRLVPADGHRYENGLCLLCGLSESNCRRVGSAGASV